MSITALRLSSMSRLAAVLLLLAGTHRAAAQTIGITVGDSSFVQVEAGAKLALPVTIDLSLSGPLNIAALQGAFSWSSQRLMFDSLRVGGESGFTLSVNSGSAPSGSVTFNAFRATPLPASALLATAYFTATVAPGGTRLELTPATAGNDVGTSVLHALQVRNLEVCVSQNGNWGDVNDDGAINVIDAQQTARHSIRLSVMNAMAVASRGDVNADGTVDIIDAQQMARYSVALSAAARIGTRLFVPPTVASMSVSPSGIHTLAVNDRMQLVAARRDAENREVVGCAPITWTSSNPAVATVSAAGIVTGVGVGTATITSSSGGVSTSTSVSVVSVPTALGRGRVAAGAEFSCRLDNDGAALCWGRNDYGQLGDSTLVSRPTQGRVRGGLMFTALSANLSRMCGLTAAGTVYCWGTTTPGTAGAIMPTLVPIPVPLTRLTGSSNDHCGLTAAGETYCFGTNVGATATRRDGAPMFVQLASNVSSGIFCGLTPTGAMYCWGGQQGDQFPATPTLIPNGVYSAIAMAGGNMCGLSAAIGEVGTVRCWGENRYGELGDGTRTDRSESAPIRSTVQFTTIWSGGHIYCAKSTLGTTFCWGFGLFGNTGTGSFGDQLIPTPIAGNPSLDDLSMGFLHACARTTSSQVFCWGDGRAGQIGDGLKETRPVPTLLLQPDNLAPVETVTIAGGNFSIAKASMRQLTLSLQDAAGNPLTARTVQWSSNNPTVAAVSATGLVTAFSAGTATITAHSEGKSGVITVTVTP